MSWVLLPLGMILVAVFVSAIVILTVPHTDRRAARQLRERLERLRDEIESFDAEIFES